jgi:hypothetical protein
LKSCRHTYECPQHRCVIQVVKKLGPEKTKAALIKTLHGAVAACYDASLANTVRSLCNHVGYFQFRKIVLVAQYMADMPMLNTSGSFDDLDFQLGAARKTGRAQSQSADLVHRTSRRHRQEKTGHLTGILNLFCACLCQSVAKKKSSIHPLPAGSLESRSALHDSRMMGRYIDTGVTGSQTGGSESSDTPGKLAQDVFTAIAGYQSLSGEGVLPLRRYSYDPATRRLEPARLSEPSPAGGVASSLEVRAPSTAADSVKMRTAAPSNTATAAAPKRATIVQVISSGLTKSKRGTVISSVKAAESTAGALEVVHVPDLRLVVVCRSTAPVAAGAAAGPAGHLDCDATELWDYLLLAASCLEYKLASNVSDILADS